MSEREAEQAAFEWQVGVWDGISDVYVREIDRRFVPVVEAALARGRLGVGEAVLDLGTGTGALAQRAAEAVGPDGHVVGVDISREMLAAARRRMNEAGLRNASFREGRGEAIPADAGAFDVVLSSLTLMYVIDRTAAAREFARVLRPGGRLVASVWGPPERCDIVRFQSTAGRFAGPPPVAGVGPGALADPSPFLQALVDAGIEARVETEVLSFDFPDFDLAWEALARVTTANLPADDQAAARKAVLEEMYPTGDGPRRFDNLTQFIVGRSAG